VLAGKTYHDLAGKATPLDKADPLGYCRPVSGTGFIYLLISYDF
jgi:hypothetical protein